MSATFSSTPLPGPAGSSNGADRRDEEVARLRTPPHSIEAEQSVLGGLLIDNSAWDRAGDLLTVRRHLPSVFSLVKNDSQRFEDDQIPS